MYMNFIHILILLQTQLITFYILKKLNKYIDIFEGVRIAIR